MIEIEEKEGLSFNEIKRVPGIYKFVKPRSNIEMADPIRLIVLESREGYLVFHKNPEGLLLLEGDYKNTYDSNSFSFVKTNEFIKIG